MTKPSSDWPTFENPENELNSFFETSCVKRNVFLEEFRSLPGDWKGMDIDRENSEDENLLTHVAVSLMKLNHNKEKSCFTEVIPKSKLDSQVYCYHFLTSIILLYIW